MKFTINNNDRSEDDHNAILDPLNCSYLNHRTKIKEKGHHHTETVKDKLLTVKDTSEISCTTVDCMTLLSYNDAPSYLQFNPYILSGYRGYLSTKMCFESMFWMTNETINIWSHVFGWMLFLGLTLYDLCLLNIHASFTDKFIVGLLLGCFQNNFLLLLFLFFTLVFFLVSVTGHQTFHRFKIVVCMVMSALYHIFSCRSEEHFNCFLSFDLLGIALSMLGIYMTGVYYAYWCHKFWQQFYLTTVCAIFIIAMLLQLPRLKIDSHIKMLVFVLWAAYGVVPTLHWTVMMGGLENPIVALLLPRVIVMYGIIGVAFFIYITRVPERFFTGKVDYIGSSHQWWHFFVVVALYYWHNTGIKYIEYRMNHGCAYDLGRR